MRKGQMQKLSKGESLRQAAFIAELLAMAISIEQKNSEAPSFVFLQHGLFESQ